MNPSSNRHYWSLLFLIFCLSLPVKLIAAHNMVWDMDIVPVIARGQGWLDGGAFPAVGTLSSVAAYNMPFLVWMHLPALLLTDDPRVAMLVTLVIFNFIGTLYCYLAGAAVFQPRTGIIAAALFTFSETSVSSAYTAWAQLLLPVFFIAVFYHLWQWRITATGWHLAGAGIIATAGFMTHFTGIMLFPAMLIFAVVSRARWQWWAFFLGAVMCGLMLAPYLAFEAERDFVDLRAFLTRRSPIPAEVLAQYEQTYGQNLPAVTDNDIVPAISFANMPETAENIATASPENVPQTRSQSERIVAFLLSLPGQYIAALGLFNTTNTAALNQAIPAISAATARLSSAITLIFFGVCFWAVYRCVRDFTHAPKATPVLSRTYTKSSRSRHISQAHVVRPRERRRSNAPHNDLLIVRTSAGRLLLLLLFILVFITGLIVTRATPTEQGTYYAGLLSLQMLVVAYGISAVFDLKFQFNSDSLDGTHTNSDKNWRGYPTAREQNHEKRGTALALITVLLLTLYLWCLGADRILRITQHNDMVYTRYNVWLYRHLEAVTHYIATDWQAQSNPVISYDILPEMPNLWWVLPWNSVDPLYRMGVPYDYLLAVQHGIINTNQSANGLAENPDYIIVYLPGLARYAVENYEMAQFGAIYVLKPRHD